ncbi:MAG: prepilin peptidase [bacterium]
MEILNEYKILIAIFIFLFGLGMGSFLNVVIFRVPKKISVNKSRSACPYCHRQLTWYDLIPLLSFLLLKGRCRYCQKKISWQYPIVEFITATLFVVLFLFPPLNGTSQIFDLVYLFAICSLLLALFVIDLKTYLLPNVLTFLGIAISIIYLLIEDIILFANQTNIEILDWHIVNGLLAAIIGGGFFWILYFFSKEKWMGGGDVKLVILMGLFLGYPVILIALFIAFFTGAIFGLVLIALGKKKMSSKIPFGTFLVPGTLIALFYGQAVIDWYLGMIL